MFQKIKDNSLIVAVIAAVIGGIFTLIPLGYSYFTDKSEKLSYIVNKGPILSSPENDRKIVFVRVDNDGEKEVSDIYLDIKVDNATIEKYAHSNIPGVEMKESVSDNSYGISVKSLNPHEKFSTSVMIAGKNIDNVESVTVRAKGIVGNVVDSTTSENSNSKYIRIAMLTALIGVFSTFISSILASRRNHFTPEGRTTAISYIVSQVGLTDLSDKIMISPSDLSYRRVSDILLAYARHVPEKSGKCIVALSCMLIVKNMNEESRSIVRRAISNLTSQDIEMKIFTEVKNMLVYSDTIEFREKVDEIILSNLVLGIINENKKLASLLSSGAVRSKV